jgi:hypothetical protein
MATEKRIPALYQQVFIIDDDTKEIMPVTVRTNEGHLELRSIREVYVRPLLGSEAGDESFYFTYNEALEALYKETVPVGERQVCETGLRKLSEPDRVKHMLAMLNVWL